MRPGPALLALTSLLALFGCGQSSPAPGAREAASTPVVTPEPPAPALSARAAADPTVSAPTAAAPPASAPAAPVDTHAARIPGAAPVAAAPADTAAPTATAVAAPPAPSAAPTATAAADVKMDVMSPKVAEPTFNVWMQSAGHYKAGEQGAVQVVLVAKGAFHCNDKYPYKFKLGAAPAGVSFPQPVVRTEGIRITPDRSIMTVPFVPSAPGDARLGGTFSFSVCSATSCQVETRDLAITVKVD